MKERMIKTKVGQLFVSYQPAEKIAVFLSGAGSLPTYENFLPVIRKLPKNWGYLTIDYPNAGQSPLENQENFVLDDLVQSILEVLSQFKVIQYAVCAHSISGLVAVKVAESEPFCQGLILIEPTTYSVLYGELAQNPYPEFLALQEKVQTLGGGYEYLKKIGQESFSVADFKILWTKAERSSDRFKSVQEGFQHYCSIAKSDFQNLDISFQFPIFILSQAYREQEYKDSEFASQSTQIILGGSHHYLHWSQSEKIAELLLKCDGQEVYKL